MKKLLLLAVTAAITVAVPATAKSPNPSKSHKCQVHKVAYIAAGTLVTWAATANSDGTYTGTVTVHVTRTSHSAKGDKNSDVTYTLTDAKVRFGGGANPPTAGDHVKVIGKITAVAKKCTSTTDSGKITVHRVVVRTPAPSK